MHNIGQILMLHLILIFHKRFLKN